MDAKKPRKSLISLLKLTCRANKGQALVEFTLIFMLMLVIIWIPADMGLMMYSGQIAQNAGRDGVRIAAADPTLGTGPLTCDMPCDGETGLLDVVADRMRGAFMKGATITIERDAVVIPACNAQVTVTIDGNYTFWFYRMLRYFGANVPPTKRIVRVNQMRWEHQC